MLKDLNSTKAWHKSYCDKKVLQCNKEKIFTKANFALPGKQREKKKRRVVYHDDDDDEEEEPCSQQSPKVE